MSVIKDGFAVSRGLFNQNEITEIENAIKAIHLIGDDDKRTDNPCPDAVRKYPQLLLKWVKHPKLLYFIRSELQADIKRSELQTDIKFLQHVDAHANYYQAAAGWHRDSACRSPICQGEDWDEGVHPYRVTRVALYTRPNILSIREGSHRIPGEDHRIHDIKTEPGDVIAFDPRIYHKGSIYHPKYSLFIAYGVPNEHSLRHYNFYLHKRPDLGYEEMSADTKAQLGNLLLN